MKFRLIDIGREHYTGEVEARDCRDLHRALHEHLASHSIEIRYSTGDVYAGLRRVGRIEPVDAEAGAIIGPRLVRGGV